MFHLLAGTCALRRPRSAPVPGTTTSAGFANQEGNLIHPFAIFPLRVTPCAERPEYRFDFRGQWGIMPAI
jgi:hypothetical protein